MSKAKAILQRIVDGDNRGDFFISNALLKEIEAALSEPEQEQEQEPVAWMWEDKRNDSNSWATVVSPAKPEKCEYHVRNIRPLYTAPPKREPLSERELYKAFIEELVQDNYGKWDIKSFVNGIRFAEKAHGIGGGG